MRNLARYAGGGYNPDTRVDVIISVMVRITPRVCFDPCHSCSSPANTSVRTSAALAAQVTACVDGLLAVVAEPWHTQRNLVWSLWLCGAVMYIFLCRSSVKTKSGFSDPTSCVCVHFRTHTSCPCVRAVLDARIPHASGLAGHPRRIQGAALCAPRLPDGHPHCTHQRRAHRQGIS